VRQRGDHAVPTDGEAREDSPGGLPEAVAELDDGEVEQPAGRAGGDESLDQRLELALEEPGGVEAVEVQERVDTAQLLHDLGVLGVTLERGAGDPHGGAEGFVGRFGQRDVDRQARVGRLPPELARAEGVDDQLEAGRGQLAHEALDGEEGQRAQLSVVAAEPRPVEQPRVVQDLLQPRAGRLRMQRHAGVAHRAGPRRIFDMTSRIRTGEDTDGRGPLCHGTPGRGV
jgi:hypothetical protein